MDPTRQFIVMIDSDQHASTIVDLVVAGLTEAVRVKSNSFDYKGNSCELLVNDEADSDLVSQPDGFFHYKYELQVTPLKNKPMVDQIEVARGMCELIADSISDKFVLCANFEDSLPQFGPTA
ncbi:hypothetical protein [Aeoliella sp.]|uniref:hypothetical protein n=1 Tax=Aeoliella sp. TaxID=2795800 RepID=UPI003CCBB6B1